MGRGPEQTLPPRRHTSSQQMYEKMINFTIREMQIKTTRDTPVRTAVNNKTRRGCGGKGAPLTAGGNVNWYRHQGKECGGSSEHQDWSHHDSATSLLGISRKT